MNPPKPRTLKQLEKDMAYWNFHRPIGTPVTRYKLINPLREPEDTVTRSEAWIMGGHSVVVKVEGIAGGVLIESLRLRTAKAENASDVATKPAPVGSEKHE